MVGVCHFTRWRARSERMGDITCLHAGPVVLILTLAWRPKRALTPQWLLLYVPILASISAWRCPPSAHSCCCCPVSRALGGSHGAATMCAERMFLRLRTFSVASAAAGFTKLGLLLWRSGAPEHFICELLAFGAAFSPNFLSVPLSYVPAIARSRSLPHAASAREVHTCGRPYVRVFALIAA
jgi:hypothetical protein